MTAHTLHEHGPILLDHFENPRNVGDLDHPEAVGRAENPACGDLLVLSLRIRGGTIEQARFRASGCSASIASSSMATVLLQGRTLEEAAAITNQDVASALGGLPAARLHCSVLAEEAIAAALADYRARQGGGPA